MIIILYSERYTIVIYIILERSEEWLILPLFCEAKFVLINMQKIDSE